MGRICVVTSDGRAYYAIVSKLRGAGLPFLSLLPSDDVRECALVVTTRKEVSFFAVPCVALEDLDENQDVARGQILSKLGRGGQNLIVGVDPGSRIGTAAFLGDALLASRTFNSRKGAVMWIADLIEKVPSRRSLVRVGDGDPRTAKWLAEELALKVSDVQVEIVDESGTSRARAAKGLQKDQGSAAKIALRKGLAFGRLVRAPRSR